MTRHASSLKLLTSPSKACFTTVTQRCKAQLSCVCKTQADPLYVFGLLLRFTCLLSLLRHAQNQHGTAQFAGSGHPELPCCITCRSPAKAANSQAGKRPRKQQAEGSTPAKPKKLAAAAAQNGGGWSSVPRKSASAKKASPGGKKKPGISQLWVASA